MTVTGAPDENQPFPSDEAHYEHHRNVEAVLNDGGVPRDDNPIRPWERGRNTIQVIQASSPLNDTNPGRTFIVTTNDDRLPAGSLELFQSNHLESGTYPELPSIQAQFEELLGVGNVVVGAQSSLPYTDGHVRLTRSANFLQDPRVATGDGWVLGDHWTVTTDDAGGYFTAVNGGGNIGTLANEMNGDLTPGNYYRVYLSGACNGPVDVYLGGVLAGTFDSVSEHDLDVSVQAVDGQVCVLGAQLILIPVV